MPQVGDIVTLLGSGERKIIVGDRTEIVPTSGDWEFVDALHARIMYRLAGKVDQWFSAQDIEIFSPRKP